MNTSSHTEIFKVICVCTTVTDFLPFPLNLIEVTRHLFVHCDTVVYTSYLVSISNIFLNNVKMTDYESVYVD